MKTHLCTCSHNNIHISHMYICIYVCTAVCVCAIYKANEQIYRIYTDMCV